MAQRDGADTMNILVTGASGFVGSALIRQLLARRADFPGTITAALRRSDAIASPNALVRPVVVGELSGTSDWSSALTNVDVVVHCAARVHVMNDTAADPLVEFRRVNVDGTLHLARQAMSAGVRRFVFISSIKVNGEQTPPGLPFRADDVPRPSDPYGVSKMEAEQQLLQLAAEGAMEVVIIRPVLVYGPGVKANFLSMMRWLDKGVPLPLGGILGNRRSMVALDNLVDLIIVCSRHPAAVGQIFLVSDGEDLSTTGLLRKTAQALDKPARLLPFPASLLTLAARLLGRPGIAQRLCGSLQVDIEKNRTLLGWTPPVPIDEALRRTAAAYRAAP
ncbi:UDP-glucose 4-epimerase family protein [Herbaspirillum sp. alder98]|uniref:UDP-glucose 4-epimerase family protein n=1 Tax=Herbaspirillum sp. alder98 TaxID=2913096 RepID=UPI0039BD0BC0